MVDQLNEQVVSDVLKATSDLTRRRLLTQLVQQGPMRVTDLASFYDMSLNAVSKHIKVLESAGLVSRKTSGRVHWIEADLNSLKEIEQWFAQLKSIWEMRLDKLDSILTQEEPTHD